MAGISKFSYRFAAAKALKIILTGLLVLVLCGLQFKQAAIIGVHIESATESLPWLVKPSWVRRWLRWYEIETQPGIYSWDASQDAAFEAVKRTGSPLLLTVITTPDWARIYPEKRCSPPRPGYLDEFARFINAAIERYQPQAIELINEPEVAHDQIGDELDYWIGCWGPHGYYYAEMLETVYPAVKAAHPDILLVAGSLMISETHENFWPEVIQSGAGGNYDIVSFHAYTYHPINDFDVVERKAKLLRDSGEAAPLWLTETSLLCSDLLPCSEAFETDQANYLKYIFDHRLELNIDMIFWYTLAGNDWQNSDLVAGGKAKLSWYLYRDIAQHKLRIIE